MSAERKSYAGRLFVIGGAVLSVLLIGLYFIILRPQFFNPKEHVNRLFFTFLALILIILILGVLFILLRNFVKLIVERRKGILGSKFRTKLVFIFFIPLLVPSIALFYAAITIIQASVENLLTPPVNDITKYSKEIVDDFNENLKERAFFFAEGLSGEITAGRYLDMDKRESLSRLIDLKRMECKLDLIVVYLGENERYFVYNQSIPSEEKVSEQEITSFPEGVLADTLKGEKLQRVVLFPKGYIVKSSVPILSSFNRNEVLGALMAGIYVGENLAIKAKLIDESRTNYLQMKYQRRYIKMIYIEMIAFITLLILFSATWIGMYLTRQITVPIQKLAEGTREISAGNLDYRVDVGAGDELGMLVDSFNAMTGELKADKSALEERRTYIETLLDNITAGVISLDAKGKVTTFNKAAMRILSLEQSMNLRGRNIDEVVMREEFSKLRECIHEVLGNENLVLSKEFLFTIGGTPLSIAANFLSLKDVQNNYLGILIVLEDLTQLIRAQKMEAWREVAKRIAHEIKNPLTPIQLSAQRIMKKYGEGTDDLRQTIDEGTSTIISQVNALKGMVDEFSKFARMPVVRMALTEPHEVIDSAVKLYEAIHPGIRFERDYEKKSIMVTMDAEQIKRVIINLIDNSIEAMNGRGNITIATKVILETRRFRIEFSDNGPGISPEDKGKLFIPYFSTKKVGTGLGLAIIQRIISDHNGFITVEDNVPAGTRFIIELPL